MHKRPLLPPFSSFEIYPQQHTGEYSAQPHFSFSFLPLFFVSLLLSFSSLPPFSSSLWTCLQQRESEGLLEPAPAVAVLQEHQSRLRLFVHQREFRSQMAALNLHSHH